MGLSFIKYIPLIASLTKGFINNTKHDIKIKTFDKTKEKIDTMEHLLIKMEKKLGECRNEIEELRRQILFSRVINVILGMLLVFLVIFLR